MRFNPHRCHVQALVLGIQHADEAIGSGHGVIASRVLTLPLAFDDQWNKEAVVEYAQSIGGADRPYRLTLISWRASTASSRRTKSQPS